MCPRAAALSRPGRGGARGAAPAGGGRPWAAQTSWRRGREGGREHGKRKGKRDLPPLEEEEGGAGGSRETPARSALFCRRQTGRLSSERGDPATEPPPHPTPRHTHHHHHPDSPNPESLGAPPRTPAGLETAGRGEQLRLTSHVESAEALRGWDPA